MRAEMLLLVMYLWDSMRYQVRPAVFVLIRLEALGVLQNIKLQTCDGFGFAGDVCAGGHRREVGDRECGVAISKHVHHGVHDQPGQNASE